MSSGKKRVSEKSLEKAKGGTSLGTRHLTYCGSYQSNGQTMHLAYAPGSSNMIQMTDADYQYHLSNNHFY